MRNQTTDSSLQRTLVSQIKMKYFALNAQRFFYIIRDAHISAHRPWRQVACTRADSQTLMLTLSNHANACTLPSQSKSCSWRNANSEPITCAPRRCLTLLFRRLMEAMRMPSMYSPGSTPTVILGPPCSCISSITTTIYKTA